MTASFSKLDTGAWGIRLESEMAPNAGDQVQVTKKNGESKTVTIESVLSGGTGPNGKTFTCTIAPTKRPYIRRDV